jgi:AcrR family transcriptional regulator
MTDSEFDSALIAAALQIAADEGWRQVTVVAAARAANLSLARARERFPGRGVILVKFGRMADQAVLDGDPAEGSVRDQLFDLLMRRFDALQSHRPGILALMRALPLDPGTALRLACATRRSMRWMLQTAGVPANGLFGELRVKGLLGVWLWALRTWEHDDSEDLTATMAALDTALARAEQAAGWLGGPGPRSVRGDDGSSGAEPDAAEA